MSHVVHRLPRSAYARTAFWDRSNHSRFSARLQSLRALVVTGRTEISEIQGELDERPIVRSVWQWEDVEWEKLSFTEKIEVWWDIVVGRTWDELRVRYPERSAFNWSHAAQFRLRRSAPLAGACSADSASYTSSRTSGRSPGRTVSVSPACAHCS